MDKMNFSKFSRLNAVLVFMQGLLAWNAKSLLYSGNFTQHMEPKSR